MARILGALGQTRPIKRACLTDVYDKFSKKNAKKKKGVQLKRACWTAVSDNTRKKNPKQKKGLQHEDFAGGHPS